MITEITADTTPTDYAEVVANCEAERCRIPDSPAMIAAAERHEDNLLWLRRRAAESKLAACAAILAACFWATWEASGCASAISNHIAARARQEAHVAIADPDRAGVGWDGVRSRQWRATGQAFGWQS